MKEKNVSKYVDFYIVENTSKKTGVPYYALVIRVKDKQYVLQFINKDTYDLLCSSLD